MVSGPQVGRRAVFAFVLVLAVFGRNLLSYRFSLEYEMWHNF